MTHLQWETLHCATPGPAPGGMPGMASLRWYRARLPHGWLVQTMSPRVTMVGGRQVVLDDEPGEASSATFVPFGPAPWN